MVSHKSFFVATRESIAYLPSLISRSIKERRAIRVLSEEYHSLYETDETRRLKPGETLKNLDVFNPDQTFVFQLAENTAKRLGIDLKKLHSVYNERKTYLERNKDVATVRDLTRVLLSAA